MILDLIKLNDCSSWQGFLVYTGSDPLSSGTAIDDERGATRGNHHEDVRPQSTGEGEEDS